MIRSVMIVAAITAAWFYTYKNFGTFSVHQTALRSPEILALGVNQPIHPLTENAKHPAGHSNRSAPRSVSLHHLQTTQAEASLSPKQSTQLTKKPQIPLPRRNPFRLQPSNTRQKVTHATRWRIFSAIEWPLLNGRKQRTAMAE